MENLLLNKWLTYKDRDSSPYNPLSETEITIERLFDKQIGNVDDVFWKREEWLIRSALIPIEQIDEALQKIDTPHSLTFETGWGIDNKFNFCKEMNFEKITLYPFALTYKHPITKEVKVEINRDFTMYHALETQDFSSYYHPIDKILIIQTEVEKHDFLNPTPKVTVHLDYLKDFLSEINMGLFVSIVADRFANAKTKEELGITESELHKIDHFTYMESSVSSPKESGNEYFRGWSIIHKNLVIKPYSRPKYERTPWFYFGDIHVDNDDLPKFIINAQGEKRKLPQNTFLPSFLENKIGSFGFLYFRPDVLMKYLQLPNYSVFFHMRNWGSAKSSNEDEDIYLGINSKGLVTAFAPNIAKLSPSEQAYWASFSSLPSGEVCEEMFQSIMQQMPPKSPGVTEAIKEALIKLDNTFSEKYSVSLLRDLKLSNKELQEISVGPIGNNYSEVTELAKLLYQWTVETIQIKALKSVIKELGGSFNTDEKQIKLIDRILILRNQKTEDVQRITDPLRGLNKLRISSAHIGASDLEKSFQLLGIQNIPKSARAGWDFCVDATIKSLIEIAASISSDED